MPSEVPAWRRRARALAVEACTRLWLPGLGAMARLAPRRARPWRDAGGGRVWVVAPHPDDETAGCAGSIAAHVAAGDAVTVIVATDGRGSRALGLGPEEMARRRRLEAEAAIRRLGAHDLVWLGLPEVGWEEATLTARLGALWGERPAPDVLYGPSAVDFHPEHLRAAFALARALAEAQPAPAVRVYPVQVPLTATLANVVADVTPWAGAIEAAIAAHATQRASLEATMRRRRYAAARHRRGRLAETFWEMSAEAYVRLHLELAAGEDGSSFRGLRPGPWTDPLACWRGRNRRRAWAEALCGS